MERLIAIGLAIYIPIFFVILLLVVRHFKNYESGRFSISQLGTKKSRYYRLFNISTLTMGILVLMFGYIMPRYFPVSTLATVLCAKLIFIAGVLAIANSFVRYDLLPKLHDVIALLSCMTVFALCLVLSTMFSYTSWLSPYLFIFIAGVLFCSVMMAWYAFGNYKKQKFPKATWFWEWGILFSQLSLLFAISSRLIKL